MQPTSDKRSGFTVVELIVGIGIMSAITIGIVSLIMSLVGNATRSIETTKQVREAQSALATIKDDLRLTNKFLITSSVSDDLDRSDSAWSHRGNPPTAGGRTLLLQKRSTSLTSVSPNRLPLYRVSIPSFTGVNCVSTAPNAFGDLAALGYETTTENEYSTIIYYLHDNTLYRRTSVQPIGTPAYCPGHASVPTRTCVNPPATSTPSENCKETDVMLAQNVTEFDILYYDTPSAQTHNTTIHNAGATQNDLDGVSTVQIRITTNKDIGGRDNEFTSKIRANRGSTL